MSLKVTLDTPVDQVECDPEGCNKFDHYFTGFVFIVGTSKFIFGGGAREREWSQIITAFKYGKSVTLRHRRNITPGAIDHFKETDNISLSVLPSGDLVLKADFICHSFSYSNTVSVEKKDAVEAMKFIEKYLDENCSIPCHL